MVTAEIEDRTSTLVPVPPEWLARQGHRGPTTNRNINDCYWQRSANESDPGYIIVGPSSLMGANGRPLTAQAEKWMRQGRRPLTEFSYTNRVSPITDLRETIEVSADRLNTPDRYYWLFVNGGAHLFPIEQLVEHHWHIDPPYGLSTDVFPQLKEWDVPDPFYCGACAGEQPPHNSEEQLVSHLLISHRMTLPQARDLIESYDPHKRPRGAKGVTLRRKAQSIERTEEKRQDNPPPPQTPKLIICDQCGEQFTNYPARAKHNRDAHATSQPDGATTSPAENENDDA